MDNLITVVLAVAGVAVAAYLVNRFFLSRNTSTEVPSGGSTVPSTGGGVVTPTPPSVVSETPQLETMTKAELLEYANQSGVSVSSRLRKEDIKDIILSQQPNQQ